MSDILTSPELTAEQASSLTRATNYGTWRFQKSWKPLYIADAEGCWITDGAGKRYLDFSAQLMCVNLGHKNPRVVEAIAEQARELCYVAPGYATAARAKLSAKLLEVLPAGLEKFFFATSGT
jgi:taurine--2-oxoglutarate transaminase